MLITFLIGNGFDLNLGLKTCYTDFYGVYLKDTKGDSDEVNTLKKIIKEDSETRSCNTWACAEFAFGEYTEEFEVGQAEEFCSCHEDFCEKLADYLELEEKKLNFNAITEHILNAFKNPSSTIFDGFCTREKLEIQKIIQSVSEADVFNYINFNYTTTLDECINIVKNNSDILGTKKIHGTDTKHRVGKVLHIHGTTQENIVLGVDNESQLKNIAIFEKEPTYLTQIVKSKTNFYNGELNTENAIKILDGSKIIYIYGMSLGKTDSMWWSKICDLLAAKKDILLLIYAFDLPKKMRIKTQKNLKENEIKNNFLSYSNIDEKIKDEIKKRIYIHPYNIFENIKNIVNHADNDIID